MFHAPQSESVLDTVSRKRARSFSIPAAHLKELWSAVAEQRIDCIHAFFETYPGTGAYWAQFPEQLASSLRTHARAGTHEPNLDSLAALFIDGGVPMLPEDMDAVLRHILAAPVSEKARKHLLTWAKEHPARAETLLVLAADAQNLGMFQHTLATYGSGSAKAVRSTIWFDATAADATTRRSVLHAVVRWPDAAIRRELLSVLLPHCSAAYVTQTHCQLPNARVPMDSAGSSSSVEFVPGLAAGAIAELPWTLPVAHSAIEEAALRADTASLATLLCRAREDALLDAPVLVRALYTSLRAAAIDAATPACSPIDNPVACTGREDVMHAHGMCATMLMGCMSVRMLLDFHVHLDALRNKAIAVKARATAVLATDRPKPANSAVAALADTTAIERVLSSLSKAHALYAAIVKRAKDEEERVAFALAERTQEADAAFESRTRQYMSTIERSLAMREEMQQLRLEKRVLMDMLERKSTALRTLAQRLITPAKEMQSGVVTEAVSALTPMSVSTSASLDVVRQDHHEVAVTSEDAEFAKWIEDMDAAHADMLALLMPEVPTTQLPSSVSLFSFGTAYEDGSAGLTNASFPTSPTSTRAQAPRTLQPHYGSLERTGSSHSLISMHSSDGSMEERFSKLQASAISLTALEDRLARLQAPMSVASKIVGGSSRHAVALALPK